MKSNLGQATNFFTKFLTFLDNFLQASVISFKRRLSSHFMDKEIAETRALEVLNWVLSEDDLIQVFMGATGASQDDLRSNTLSHEFLISILDFVLMDDSWVISCSKFLNIDPSQIQVIKMSLDGGQEVNWT